MVSLHTHFKHELNLSTVSIQFYFLPVKSLQGNALFILSARLSFYLILLTMGTHSSGEMDRIQTFFNPRSQTQSCGKRQLNNWNCANIPSQQVMGQVPSCAPSYPVNSFMEQEQQTLRSFNSRMGVNCTQSADNLTTICRILFNKDSWDALGTNFKAWSLFSSTGDWMTDYSNDSVFQYSLMRTVTSNSKVQEGESIGTTTSVNPNMQTWSNDTQVSAMQEKARE